MNGENRLLFTNEPVEFEKKLVEVQDFKKIPRYFQGFWGIYLKLIKGKKARCQRVTGWTWKH
jgi:hypothetical protein